MSVVTSLHVGAAALAAASLALLTLRRPLPQGPTVYLAWAAVATVPWALSVASVTASGIHPWHQILWFPSIAYAAGAFLLWAGAFSRYGWRPSRALVALVLGAPTLILAVRLLWGHDARVPLFVVNTVYSFGVLVVATAWVSQRANDPAQVVRVVARGVLTCAIVILIAEAFRSNVTDLVASLTIAALSLASVRAGDSLRARPSPDVLIDDLGALLFVFDHDQRLVDLNAPARLFYTLRGAGPPELGSTGAQLLGADLASGVDAFAVDLAAGTDTVRFGGYVQRLPSHGTPSRGWVCLLRRSSAAAPAELPRSARLAAMNRLPAHDPTTRLLSPRAFDQALATASSFPGARSIPATALVLEAEDPATLRRVARVVADGWEHRRETIAAGRCGEVGIGLVARDVPEHVLATWCEQVLSGVSARRGTRSGTLAHAHDLVADAQGDLRSVGRSRPLG